MKRFLCMLFLAMLALPVFAQPGTFAEPAGADLDKFPIQAKPLSPAKQAELELAPKVLDKPVVVQNHFRNIRGGRFVLEQIPAGTIVLVDKSGKIRYKSDCGNRLVELQQCPTSLGTSNAIPIPPVAVTPRTSSAWSRFWNNAGEAWRNTWANLGSFFGFLLPLLLFLALLGLLGYVIYRAIQNMRQDGPQPPAVLNQPQAPAPPLAMAARAGAGVQNAPVAPAAPAPPAPQAPVPQAFPAGRVVVDLGNDVNATRMQAGQNFARIEYNENPDDGSVSVRIFRRT